jgi:hypothetical protein
MVIDGYYPVRSFVASLDHWAKVRLSNKNPDFRRERPVTPTRPFTHVSLSDSNRKRNQLRKLIRTKVRQKWKPGESVFFSLWRFLELRLSITVTSWEQTFEHCVYFDFQKKHREDFNSYESKLFCNILVKIALAFLFWITGEKYNKAQITYSVVTFTLWSDTDGARRDNSVLSPPSPSSSRHEGR